MLTPTKINFVETDVLDAWLGIDELRLLIEKGEDTGGDGEWHLEEIVRSASEGFSA